MKYYRTEKQRLYYEKVISLYRDQHMGKTRIAKIIPVSDWTISNWIRTFVAENPKYKNKRMKMAEEKRKQKAIEESLQSPLPNDKQSLQAMRVVNQIVGKTDGIRFDIIPAANLTEPQADSVGPTDDQLKDERHRAQRSN